MIKINCIVLIFWLMIIIMTNNTRNEVIKVDLLNYVEKKFKLNNFLLNYFLKRKKVF